MAIIESGGRWESGTAGAGSEGFAGETPVHTAGTAAPLPDWPLRGRAALFAEDDEAVGDGTFVAVAGAVHDLAVEPEGGGAAAVEIDRLGAAELDEVGGEFGKGHADGEVALPSVHFEQVEEIFVPAEGGARMARKRGGQLGHLAAADEGGAAADGRLHAGEVRDGGGGNF